MSWLVRVNAVWRVPLILTLTAVMASLSILCSLFDSRGRLQHGCARVWSRLIFWISRVRVELEGLPRLDPTGSYIFASNHLSMFDIWAFLAYLPFQIRFVSKASLFRWPFLGWHLKRAGHLCVDRRRPRKVVRDFQEVAKKFENDVSIVVFPEGKRTWGKTVAPFKRGSFLLATQSRAPIVPVTIIGTHRLLPRGSVLISPGRMCMIIHSPLEYEQYRSQDLTGLVASVRNTILKSYRQVS